jgi:hypothetical protein
VPCEPLRRKKNRAIHDYHIPHLRAPSRAQSHAPLLLRLYVEESQIMSCGCNGLHGHPHTVRASTVPLYLQGAELGQIDPTIEPLPPDVPIDLSMPAPIVPDFSVPSMLPPDISLSPIDTSALFTAPVDPLIASGFSPADAATIQDLASKGWLNQQDWNDLMSGNVTASELAKINYDASAAQEAAAAAAAATSAAKAATGVVKALTPSGSAAAVPPGPSPRVTATPAAASPSWFTKSTSIGGSAIPNWVLMAAPALLLIALTPGRRR